MRLGELLFVVTLCLGSMYGLGLWHGATRQRSTRIDHDESVGDFLRRADRDAADSSSGIRAPAVIAFAIALGTLALVAAYAERRRSSRSRADVHCTDVSHRA